MVHTWLSLLHSLDRPVTESNTIHSSASSCRCVCEALSWLSDGYLLLSLDSFILSLTHLPVDNWNHHEHSYIFYTQNPNDSFRRRGGYSGKLDCLVLPKNLAFYSKPAKNCCEFGQKDKWPNPYEGAELAQNLCLLLCHAYHNPITTYFLTLSINWFEFFLTFFI